MSLKEKLKEINDKASEAGSMQAIIFSLDEETRWLLEAMLKDDRISTRSIFDALKAEGYRISRDTVSSYRKSMKNVAT